MSATVLVTGGAGYVGSHCCKLLAQNGYRPVVYDNLSTGHRDFVKWGPLIEGDIRDRKAIERVIEAERPAAVMHLAGLALVGESVAAPERYWDINVCGTLTLLEAMRVNRCDRLIFSSTCAVYGDPDRVPVDETAAKAPVSPYGASKLTAEWMMRGHEVAHGLKSVRLRYFNACGADPDGEIGEDHEPETHLVPLVLDVALGRRESIEVFGTDYPTPDGTAIRDYVHVCDIAAAHLAALDHLISGGEPLAANLGTGRGVSVAEVIAAVETVTGRKVATRTGPRRSGDAVHLVADPALTGKRLGWRAERSALAEVVGDAWRWHRARFADAAGWSQAAEGTGCLRAASVQ